MIRLCWRTTKFANKFELSSWILACLSGISRISNFDGAKRNKWWSWNIGNIVEINEAISFFITHILSLHFPISPNRFLLLIIVRLLCFVSRYSLVFTSRKCYWWHCLYADISWEENPATDNTKKLGEFWY